MNLSPYMRALAAQAVAGPLSWGHYRGLPVLPPSLEERTEWPRVTVVVPARDEERRLPALLASLRALAYPDYDVVVVDDNSTDATAAVAAAGGARVVRGLPLPEGWTGKAYACHQGMAAASGAWLLFTDADTVHAPTSLRAAIAYAEARELGALSLMTGQRCETFAERLLLPLAYAVLFAGVSPRRVNGGAAEGRVRRPSPLANGQYMLFRREAYARVGGHSAIRGSVIEDAALARALAREGVPYRLCRGESLVEVRMYGSLRELWEGFRKNAARYVLDDPRRLPGTALYSAALGTTLPLLARAAARRERHASSLALAALGYLVSVAGLVPWYRRFGVPAAYAALYPLGVGLFGLITLDSLWRVVGRRGASWKGRAYR